MSRTITRGLRALALAGLASLTMIIPAAAAPCSTGTYPPAVQCSSITLSVTQTTPGGTFTVTVQGFQAGSPVTFELHSAAANLGTFTATSLGGLTAAVKVPVDFPLGVHTVTASGVAANGSAQILSVPLTVVGVALTGGDVSAAAGVVGVAGAGLPFTGFELGAASLLGAGLLGAGGIAVVSGRKRRAGLNGA